MPQFKDSVIVIDAMGDNFNSQINYYFSEGRHHNIQMIVMCHKPAQINNLARTSCDTIYITTYNGADLFDNFYSIFNPKHDYLEIVKDLNSNHYNITDGVACEHCCGIIKYNKKEDTVIIDIKRTTIFRYLIQELAT